MADFKQALEYTFTNEGSAFTNNPEDRGGPTRWGITQGILQAWRKQPVTIEDVQALTQSEAEAIYQSLFWAPLRLDEIDSQAIATALFDMSVNLGPANSVFIAQKVLGLAKDDSILGPQTRAELNTWDPKHFLWDFSVAVANYYTAIVEANPAKKEFLDGWLARAKRLLTLTNS